MAKADDFVNVRVSLSPSAEVVSFALEKWAQDIKDWRPIWTDIVKLFRSHEKKHLNSEGGTTGDRFASLTEWYANWKFTHGYPDLPILQRDGVLYRALAEGGRDSMLESESTRLKVGIASGTKTQVYAKAHSEGKGPAYSGENKTPRPPVRLRTNVTDRDGFAYAAMQIAQAHVVKARREAFMGRAPDVLTPVSMKNMKKSYSATVRTVVSKTWK